MKETIGNFLLRRLEEVGIRHIFGVPGDFNLELVQQLENRGRPEWVGNCNELNASYAADGYARLNGPAALVVTNGVGALSAINGIAGSYSEHLPIVCICGSLPLRSIARRTMMHHTMADGSEDVFLRAYRQVTAAQAQLTPQNAAEEVDRLIRTAWRLKRPVYLELPSDIAYLEIQVPDEPLVLREPESDEERLASCANHIAGRLSSARRPAVLIDMDAERFGVLQEVNELTEKLQLPVATMSSSKGTFSEQSPLFAGIYFGSASSQQLRDLVEGSDCLIAIGHRRVDSTSGFFTDHLPDSAIRLDGYSADVSSEYYEGITLRAVLRRVIDSVPVRQTEPTRHRTVANSTALETSDTPLTQAEFWGALQNFVRPGDVIIAEDGTSSSGGTKLVLPEGCTFITQAIWGSIGYTLGALLGTLKAAPERRHILLIGDGSFQLTAQELSTILRHDLKPLIFLINNGGYTIERTILGLHAKYNDVANWRYADLPQVFSRREVASHVVTTSKELSEVLRTVDDSFIFVELLMKPDDAPLGLIRGGHASANLDYGPRGPQSAPGAQIPVPKS
jgi:indolepyruvate decarboxylase